MPDFAKEVLPINLEDEMRQSYLDYAMSVIVGRALPDVRDGLKPVHRRVLFSMHEQGNVWNPPIANRRAWSVTSWVSTTPTATRPSTTPWCAWPSRSRCAIMLVDGQGNFGSVDGDPPAAMRYTEVRMTRIADTLLDDLDKETVDFVPNYDNTEHEPTVLPARFPNLLVNGSSGIAVGMATNIPPHNLREIIDACLAIIDNPLVTIEELMEIVPGRTFRLPHSSMGCAASAKPTAPDAVAV
jgi:DNA gyrase subunit A